jgi:hypothetical protein
MAIKRFCPLLRLIIERFLMVLTSPMKRGFSGM